MPWDCKSCGFAVKTDDPACPSCDNNKDTWTLVAEKTRTFRITGSRFLVLRSPSADPLPEGDLDADALNLDMTPVFAAVSKESVLRLSEAGERPRAANVTVVRLLPRKGQKRANFLLEVLYETAEIDEADLDVELPSDLKEGGHSDVLLLGVYGAEDTPESPWEDIELIDVHEEETEHGHAPFVEVSALKKKVEKLTVAKLGRVCVRCLEDDGDPIADAEAELHLQSGEEVGDPKTTNAEGDVAWENMLPGSYVICFTPKDSQTFYSPVPLRSQESTTPCVVMTPEKHWVHLRVFDSDHEILVGAEVSLALQNGLPEGEVLTTDDQGEVRWDSVPADEYLAWVTHDSIGFFSTPVPVRNLGTEPAFVVAPEPHWIHLRIFDADHEPVVGAQVSISLVDDLPSTEIKTTDAQGDVRWDAVPSGEYLAWVEHESLGFFSTPIPVRSSGTEPAFVVAPEKHWVYLRVFDADDEPLVGAEVSLNLGNGLPEGEPKVTDDKGEVRWDGVPNDDYVAWVTHESTGFFSSPVTTRSLGSEPLFVMTSPAEEGLLLSLALTDDDGDPLKNHPYTLVFEGGEEPGETDDKGWLNEVLPSGLETADLHIDDEVFELQLDDLDDLDDDDDQNQLRACQARLVNLGYEPGPIDGLYGPKTKAGLLEFQEDEKLKKSGKLDDATREALLNRHGC